MIASLRAGETAGALEEVLGDLAQRLERRLELRGKLVTSLVYPAVITVLGLAVVAFLATSVIPRFEAFFQQRGGGLPGATAALSAGAASIRAWGPLVLGAGVLASGLAFVLRRSHATTGRILDRLILGLPVLGPVIHSAALATVCERLAMLLGSGVALPETLRIAGELSVNRALREQLATARDEVLAGQGLHRSFGRAPMPLLVGDVVRIGEESGHLPEVLRHLGRHFADELERRLKRLTALFEPTVLLIVGGLVGFVYLAFSQAIFAVAGGR